ncbi:YggS family pyridoxal phosphate-dependent enzyme [Pelagibacteraceae bacterium]|nr:YggS family pyridoxal phosphate-dependent enzyme [Pelagibacteraceae bacterium]
MNNYKNFINNLEKTVQLANRNIEEIDLIAVSKKKPAQDIQSVIDDGHTSFGENQIQEIERKWPNLKKLNSNIQLHFIGNIQSRKVESIHQNCEIIHSIDRMKVVKLFAEIENLKNVRRKYFIQINTGNEPQKSGVMLSDANQFITESIENYELNIVGLMSIPPINEDPKTHFLTLADMAKNFNLSSLSMGMSNDFEIALKCGATHIRVGTKIFGERN